MTQCSGITPLPTEEKNGKIPILYYTVYGHLETIARAGAEGVRCFKGEG